MRWYNIECSLSWLTSHLQTHGTNKAEDENTFSTDYKQTLWMKTFSVNQCTRKVEEYRGVHEMTIRKRVGESEVQLVALDKVGLLMEFNWR